MNSAPVVDGTTSKPGPEPTDVTPKHTARRAPLDKYAEATRDKKIAKRRRHRISLRRSHTGG
jgi:hypothetical protein